MERDFLNLDVDGIPVYIKSSAIEFMETKDEHGHDRMTITGMASTDDLDEVNDVLLPSAFEETLKQFMEFPVLLSNHAFFDPPIGIIEEAEITSSGLKVTAIISKERQDIQELIRLKALKSFSVAFTPEEFEAMPDGGRRITKVKLFEISLPTLPANRNALIESFKSAFNKKKIEVNKTVDPPVELKPRGRKTMAPNSSEILIQDVKSIAEQATEQIKNLSVAQKKLDESLVKTAEEIEALQKHTASPEAVKLMFESFKVDLEEKFKAQTAAIAAEKVQKSLLPFAELKLMPFYSGSANKFEAYISAPVDTKGGDGQLLAQFRLLHDHVGFCNSFFKARPGVYPNYRGAQSLKRFAEYLSLAEALNPEFADTIRKAISSGTAGSGAEWAPDTWSAEFIDRYRLDQQVAALFDTITIPMGTDTLRFPALAAKPKMFRLDEAVVANPDTIAKTTAGSRLIIFDPKKVGAALPISAEAVEDIIFATLPVMRDGLARAFAEGHDSMIVNGDDSGTHFDNTGGTPAYAANDVETTFKGLRKISIVNGTTKAALNVVVTDSLLFEARSLLKKTGSRPSELTLIIPVIVFYQTLGLASYTDASKFGGGVSAFLQGALNAYGGVPITMSDQWPENLNASGVFDSSVTDRTSLAWANRRGFMNGEKRLFNIETQFNALTDQWMIVATSRLDFVEMFDATNNDESVATLIDVKNTFS